MKINSKDFRVRGKKVNLKKWPTIIKPFCKSKKQYRKLLEEHVEKLSALQQLHYASGRYALLLIFQALDAAGKDGSIRHVMSGVNPEGCDVFSFKQPSALRVEANRLSTDAARMGKQHKVFMQKRQRSSQPQPNNERDAPLLRTCCPARSVRVRCVHASQRQSSLPSTFPRHRGSPTWDHPVQPL
jgi:Polyphosphate kinase 2 (PPK2)